eukprot:TRINITY_DN13127_c0_g1_i1.p1 TRINITY_DN13127_c0_g1~~TRINITY_DN13127_c0_g1_i1.p1  ORF type:complete len:432 (-),score=95.11 TRINITY_DN13127_c0_g1_i1:61-1356(-)
MIYATVLLSFAFILCAHTASADSISPFVYSIINPNNGSFSPAAQRQDHGVAFWNNELFILGGVKVSDNSVYTPDVWAFNTETGLWRELSFTVRRAQHCVVQSGEIVYLIGGIGHFNSSFGSLNLTSGVWTDLPAVPSGHASFAGCDAVDNRIAVFGGCDANNECNSTISFFHTNTSTWGGESKPHPTPQGASFNVVTSEKHESFAIVISANQLSYYSFASGNWTNVVSQALALSYHTAVTTISNHLIVLGGVSGGKASDATYYLAVNFTQSEAHTIGITVEQVQLNGTKPVARQNAAAVYDQNRVLVYGGKYQKGESSSEIWQLSVERECTQFTTCGECLLAKCFWCNPNSTTPVCVAGSVTPYVASTCTASGWNNGQLLKCRIEHPAATWLIASTIVVLVVIAILVVATYVVDYKKGKASSGGYEPIVGI